MILRFAVILALVFMSGFVFAQTNFTGNWILKENVHISGPNYNNALPREMKVYQREDSLVIESIDNSNNRSVVSSRLTVSMNGEETIIHGVSTKRKYTSKLMQSTDKKELVITTVFSMPDNENEVDFTRIETWTLENGQLRINKKSIETRSETWEANGIFQKQ